MLRNQRTEESIQVLCQLLSKKYAETQTSLLKHEIGFMLGQVGCGASEHLVRECIENEDE